MAFVKSQFALPSVTRGDGSLGDYVKSGFQLPSVTRPDGTLGAYVAFDANPVGDQYLFPAQRLAIVAAKQKAAAALAAKNKGWFGLGDTSCAIDPVTGGRVCSSNFVPAVNAPVPQPLNCPPPAPCPPCAPCPVGNPKQVGGPASPVFPVSASGAPAIATVSANSNDITPSLFRFYQRLAVNPLQARQLVLQGIAHTRSQMSRGLRGMGDTKTTPGLGPAVGPPDVETSNGADAATVNALTVNAALSQQQAVAAVTQQKAANDQNQSGKEIKLNPLQQLFWSGNLPLAIAGGGIVLLTLGALALKGGRGPKIGRSVPGASVFQSL